jgi:putative ABC transport system permease protein
VSEVALSVVLLSGAGLLLRSFSRVASVEPGIDARNVMTMVALLPPTRYPNAQSQTAYARTAIARLGAVQGVDAVGAVNTIPLSNLGSSTTFEVIGRPAAREADRPIVDSRVVQGGYFQALRIPRVAGRDFNLGDSATAPQVAILNQTAARLFFPGEDPIGKRVRLFDGEAQARTVVGIVGDTRGQALEKPSVPEVSYPFDQGGSPLVTLVVRTAGDPYAVLPALRRELVAVDPDLSFFLVRSMDELLSGTLAERRFNLWMLGGFAAAALLLAAIGLYGVISYSVTQRTRELGVRAALGASRFSILGMLLKEGMGMTSLGVGIGLAGALAIGRLLRNQLYGISPLDPIAMGSVMMVLFAVAALAIYIPARRATRVDPIIAIRAE